MKVKIVAAAVAVAVIAGGAYAVTRFIAPAHDDALTLVPTHSVLYANVFLSPSTSQKRALEDLLAKFEAIESPEEAEDKLTQLIDYLLSDSPLTYEDDLEPWLGPQAAFFVGDFDQLVPEAAALIATTDEDATRAMMDKLDEDAGEEPEEAEYESVTYDLYPDEQLASGFVEDFWVVGSESGFKAVVDTSQAEESLADVRQFDSVTSRLTDDPIAVFYADISALFEAFGRAAGAAGITAEDRAAFDALGFDDFGPVAAALSLREDGVLFESASRVPAEGPLGAFVNPGAGLLSELPAESWVALGLGDVGAYVERFLDLAIDLAPPGTDPAFFEDQFMAETGLDLRRDLLSWIGDAGLFVQGTGFLDLGGGLVLEATDAAAAADALDKLAVLAAREGAPLQPEEVAGAEGYAFQEVGMPEPVYAVASDERVVIAYGEKATEDALSGATPLSEAEAFDRAAASLGEGFDASFYLNAATAVALAENMGANRDDAYRRDVAPWVEPLSHVIAGSKLDGDVMLQRFVIGVE